jgi:hypothetical protein
MQVEIISKRQIVKLKLTVFESRTVMNRPV